MGAWFSKSGENAEKSPWRERVAGWLAIANPAARRVPTEPHKELRFTRAGQAGHFAALALLGLVVMAGLASLAWMPWHADGSPLLEHGWWVLLPLPWVLACLWAMVWCASHAYLLISPAGVEIFPLLFPSRGFRLVPWASIVACRVDARHLILDLTGGGGVVLGLSPLRPEARVLLVDVMNGRMGKVGEVQGKAGEDG